MAQEAGQNQTNLNEPKKQEPYYGERTVKAGDPRQDARKLREMMRAKRPRKAQGK